MAECENNLAKEYFESPDAHRIIPIPKFIALSIFSFNLYQFYWIYRNWKDIKNSFSEYSHISPGLRTLALLFSPIYIYFMYKQFNIIQEKSLNYERKYIKIFSISIILLNLILECLNYLPKPYDLLGILSFLPYVFIQSELNNIWATRKSCKPEFHALRTPETIFLVIGLLLWATTIQTYLK